MPSGQALHKVVGRDYDGLPTVFTCGVDPQVAQRVREAMRNVAHTLAFVTFADAMEAMKGPEAPVAVVVAPQDAAGCAAVPFVVSLTGHGRIAVVVSCSPGVESSQHIRLLALAGAHEFLFRGVDDHGVALRAVVQSAMEACAADRVLAGLLPLVPERLHPFVRFSVQFPRRALGVAAVASALSVHRKTLFKYASADGAPSPGELLAWCRLCLVAEQLQMFPLRTVEAIANDLDFASGTSLRNMMKRYTGMRASDVRVNGGLASVLTAFARARAPNPGSVKVPA